MKGTCHLQYVMRWPVWINFPSALGLKMTRACDVINTDHWHIATVIVHWMGGNKVARNWIAAMEQHEPFDIHQWMQVKAEVTRKLEYDTHLCNTDCWNACQHSHCMDEARYLLSGPKESLGSCPSSHTNMVSNLAGDPALCPLVATFGLAQIFFHLWPCPVTTLGPLVTYSWLNTSNWSDSLGHTTSSWVAWELRKSWSAVRKLCAL